MARIRADARGGRLPEPTHVVRSSPGRYQVLWSVPRGALDHARAEALVNGLAARYRADTQVIDVTRVLRLPGYRNWKRGGTPCRLVSSSGRVAQVCEFPSDLPAPRAAAAVVAPGTRPAVSGGGVKGKASVVGVRYRATSTILACCMGSVKTASLQLFLGQCPRPGTRIYTDSSNVYGGMLHRRYVNHARRQHVAGTHNQVHTNGIESFWAILKRCVYGTWCQTTPKHMHRYVAEVVSRPNLRGHDTTDLMGAWVAAMMGKRPNRCLLYDRGSFPLGGIRTRLGLRGPPFPLPRVSKALVESHLGLPGEAAVLEGAAD